MKYTRYGKWLILIFLSFEITVRSQNQDILIPVRRICSGKVIQRFFDTSPISPSGKYIALFRLPSEAQKPLPGQPGDVLLIDLKTGKEKIIARSCGWEMQLGASVKWGKSDDELYFNDVDTVSWKVFAILFNPFTGANRKMGGWSFHGFT
jgi:hypothetical protein